MIDHSDIDRIMSAVNIVDVVSEFVTLRRSGVNYKGLCPFHDDKTPSFIVSPSKGICHCFACGKGGNAVKFLMDHEQISYPEALRWLARKYNIEIHEHEQSEEEKKQASERDGMLVLNEWARQYFQDILHKTPEGQSIGMQYLRSRGFRDDIISKFNIGYSPQSRSSLAADALKKGFKEDFLIKTGLCYKKADGKLADRFSGRVIFPWQNVSGKVNAFGGRLLDSRTKGVQQKYVNSPDSDIFHKDHELFGLFLAKRAITKEDSVYLVEGYTDVISMHQGGIENVVANSGTALSLHQIRLLHRFTSNIILLYDGDEAGIHAAMRGTDMLLSEGINVKVMLLPDGDDPDSFSRKHSAQDFRQYVEQNKTDFIRFKTKLTLEGVSDPVKRSEAISGIVRSISVIPNQITRDTYLHDCASMLGISERTLINTMNGFIRSDRESKAKEAERETRRNEIKEQKQAEPQKPLSPVSDHLRELELLLVETIIKHGEEIIYKDVETSNGNLESFSVARFISSDLSADNLAFSDDTFNRILAEAAGHYGDTTFKAEPYFLSHPDIEISKLAADLVAERYPLCRSLRVELKTDSLRQRVEHLLLDFRKHIVERRLSELQTELKQAGSDIERARDLMKEYRETQQLRDNIAKMIGKDVSS